VLVGELRRLDDEPGREVLVALASQLAVGIRRSLFEERLREHAASLEARVAERTAELTEKNQEIESFLYSVSHDLKAPLISIQGYAQSLEEDYAAALAGEGAQWLGRIRKNATLMESLILDILELSRIGRVREQTEDVEMDPVLREAGAAISDRLRAAGGELRVQDRLPVVHGERKRLLQLFTNLLDNAVKYRHPQRPPRVEVAADSANGRATFHVKDNGRGIPERHRESVFALFQRVPAAGMEDPGGTGVGLAIVKRIVDTHGGSIRVESVEGEGTTFHVTLPLAERGRRVAVTTGEPLERR
jgi:signal transduction histidine kinase